MIVSLANYLI